MGRREAHKGRETETQADGEASRERHRQTDTEGKGARPLQTQGAHLTKVLGRRHGEEVEGTCLLPRRLQLRCPLSPRGHKPVGGSWRRGTPGFVGTQARIPTLWLTSCVTSGK